MGMKSMYKKKPVKKKKPAKKGKKKSSYGYQPWTMTQTTIKEKHMDKGSIYKAYKVTLEGQRAQVTLDLEVLTSNPTSIPEHVNFTEYLDQLVGKLVDINDKIKLVDFLITQEKRDGVQNTRTNNKR